MKLTIGQPGTYGRPRNFVRIDATHRGFLVWAYLRGQRYYRAVIWRPAI